MFRMLFLTFWGENRASDEVKAHLHESPASMAVPLIILAVPAALAGLVVGLPPEGGWIHKFLEPVFFDIEGEGFHLVGSGGGLMLVSLLTALAGIYVAYRLYRKNPDAPARLTERLPGAYRASLNKFYMDEFYEKVIIRPTIAGAGWLWTFFDVKVIDGAVNGIARLWELFGAALRPLQTGRAQNYAAAVFAGLVALVVIARIWGA
jgi:NADH-quinone oxidoreductase subunit L